MMRLLQQLGQLFAWVVTVAPWEQALRVRLGRHVRLLHAGIYLRIPFIDRVYRQSIRRRLSLIGAQTLTTADGKAISFGAALGYAIVDLRQLYESLHDAQDTIESEAAAYAAAFITSHVLSECTPQAVEAHVTKMLDLSRYGLGDTGFYVLSFAVVRTYRLITGEFRQWTRTATMDTSLAIGQTQQTP